MARARKQVNYRYPATKNLLCGFAYGDMGGRLDLANIVAVDCGVCASGQ